MLSSVCRVFPYGAHSFESIICQCTIIINVFTFKETFQSLQDIENNSKWIFKQNKYFPTNGNVAFELKKNKIDISSYK